MDSDSYNSNIISYFSAVIKEQTDLSLLLVYAVTMIVAIASTGLAFLNIYNILDFFQKRKLEQMKSFVEDLQGILDCQFECKLIGLKDKDNE